MPLRGNVQVFDFTVLSNTQVAQNLYRTQLKVPGLCKSLAPGQFVNVNVPGDKRHILRIPLSFSLADKATDTLELIYATVGEGTRRLSQMKPGDASDMTAPCGRPWRLNASSKRSVLVAGGVGITPIIAAARKLTELGVEYDAVIGAQTAEKLFGEEDLLALGAQNVYVTTDDGSKGTKGFVTAALEEPLSQGIWDAIYTCGPEPMMRSVAKLAIANNVACQVSMERMMSCAFGACNTCNVPLAKGGYASACMVGPVFEAKEIAW
ncbi:MAG: dihydroorotate dehydrogenase electron transfer subunit [Atopobium sp.]|nr:dihydroorotate dehydrogenase electron transfer subunit [Atopobium sp.]